MTHMRIDPADLPGLLEPWLPAPAVVWKFSRSLHHPLWLRIGKPDYTSFLELLFGGATRLVFCNPMQLTAPRIVRIAALNDWHLIDDPAGLDLTFSSAYQRKRAGPLTIADPSDDDPIALAHAICEAQQTDPLGIYQHQKSDS